MKVKYAGKWYEVAMIQESFGVKWYEIYDEPNSNPEHTDWVHNIEDIKEGEDD